MDHKFFGKTKAEWGALLTAIVIALCFLCGVSWALSSWKHWPFDFIDTTLLIIMISGVLYGFIRYYSHRGQTVSSLPHDDSNQPFTSSLGAAWQAQSLQDPTEEIPLADIISARQPPDWVTTRPNVPTKSLDTSESGELYFTINDVNSRKAGRFGKRVREYQLVTQSVRVVDSHLVDKNLIIRSGFEPDGTETELLYLQKFNWWQCGLKKIMLIFSGVIATGVVGFCGYRFNLPHLLVLVVLLFTWGWIGGWWFHLWIVWAHTTLIATDRRFLIIYKPPFRLKGSSKPALYTHLLKLEKDESQFSEWFTLINAGGYGTILADTAAQDDAWLQKIKYLRYHKDLYRVISEKRSQIAETGNQELVDIGKRQVQATEENTRELKGIHAYLTKADE